MLLVAHGGDELGRILVTLHDGPPEKLAVGLADGACFGDGGDELDDLRQAGHVRGYSDLCGVDDG